MAGLILLPVVGWTAGTFTGAVATNVLPKEISAAMGIALYGMFIAIIIPPARDEKNVLITVVMATAAGFLFAYAPGNACKQLLVNLDNRTKNEWYCESVL
jgi:predicted branched-subunit amino acid permease